LLPETQDWMNAQIVRPLAVTLQAAHVADPEHRHGRNIVTIARLRGPDNVAGSPAFVAAMLGLGFNEIQLALTRSPFSMSPLRGWTCSQSGGDHSGAFLD
jgi:hypothetical protein